MSTRKTNHTVNNKAAKEKIDLIELIDSIHSIIRLIHAKEKSLISESRHSTIPSKLLLDNITYNEQLLTKKIKQLEEHPLYRKMTRKI